MEQYLDVSELEPPEPLECVLQSLGALQEGQYLHVYHRMDPVPLYDLLAPLKFLWLSASDAQEMYHIFIWNHGDLPAEKQARQVLGKCCKT